MSNAPHTFFYIVFTVWTYQTHSRGQRVSPRRILRPVVPTWESVLHIMDPHGRKSCTSWTHMGISLNNMNLHGKQS